MIFKTGVKMKQSFSVLLCVFCMITHGEIFDVQLQLLLQLGQQLRVEKL